MFKYRLPDGSILNNDVFCKGTIFYYFKIRIKCILFLKEFDEPNNSGGNSTYISERCINRLNWEGDCLNDEHCEYTFPSICQKKSNIFYQFSFTTTMPIISTLMVTTMRPIISTSIFTTKLFNILNN
jgi:hypothetical protein